jgi:uncharacterized protein YjbJ (UPF0337 family)
MHPRWATSDVARGIVFECALCECSIYPARRPMGEIIDKVKGKIKQAAGTLTGDKRLNAEGKVDEAKGQVKGAAEDVKHAVKDAVKR